MAAAMARQEHRLRFANPPEAQGVGRIAPGGRNPLLAQVRQAGKIINARAADDPYDCFGHGSPRSIESGANLERRAHQSAPPSMSAASQCADAQIRFFT